jgi:LEA14-like dessication related protein
MRRSLAAALLLLAACAGLQDLARSAVKEPKLTFRAASIEALDLEGATVGFNFDLENPNAFGVDLARIGWRVEAEGTRIASGDLPGGLRIEASRTAPVKFPVRVRFQDVPGIVSLLGGGQDAIRYKLAGAIGVRTPIGILDLPLSHEGRLALPAVPRFALDGIAVRSVGFDAVSVDVKLRVKNPNAFALPLGALEYALVIGGSRVARAEGAKLAAVPGGGSAVVAIPVRLEVASAGRAAADLAKGGEVQVDLTGSATMAGIPLPVELRGRVPARR